MGFGPGVLQFDARYGIGFSRLTGHYYINSSIQLSEEPNIVRGTFIHLSDDQRSRVLLSTVGYSIPMHKIVVL